MWNHMGINQGSRSLNLGRKILHSSSNSNMGLVREMSVRSGLYTSRDMSAFENAEDLFLGLMRNSREMKRVIRKHSL